MSDYTQITDFSAKDALSTGDPEKVILGADFDGEFAALQTAIATKYDSTDIASEAEAEAGVLDTKIITPLQLRNVLQDNAGMAFDISQLADPNADTVLGWDDDAGAAINFTIGDGLTTSTTTLTADIDGLTLQTGLDGTNDMLMMWDADAAAFKKVSLADAAVSGGGGVPSTRTLTAGNGLTGGGDLSANRTFDVVGGNGITANANDVALTDVSAGANNPVNISSGTFTFDITALGAATMTDLAATDTIVVDDGGTAKKIQLQEMGLRVQTGQATQTLAASDMNTVMEFTATSTLTLPLNSTTALPVGVPIILNMKHATQEITVTAAASVTLVSTYHPGGTAAASDTVLAGGSAILFKTATNTWVLSGDISD